MQSGDINGINWDVIELCSDRMASSIPDGTSNGEVLAAALRIAADCVHRINPDGEYILEAAHKLLDAEFKTFQNKDI